MPLRPIEKTDFSGGVNASASPHLIGKNQVLRGDNVILDEHGSMNVRDGLVTVETTPASVVAVLARGAFTTISGERLELAVVRLANNTQQLLRLASGVWIPLGTFTDVFDTPTITPWLNRALITDGYHPPFFTDGGAFAPITGNPLSAPNSPSVSPAGTPGTTTYRYVVVAFNANGTTEASGVGSTGTGAAILNSTDYNVLTWDEVPNALGYYVWRIGGGSTQGKIATLGSITTVLDIGLTGDHTDPPTDNTTASITPGAQHLIVHRGALWAWNTAAATSTYDGPSSLRQSDFNNFQNWPVSFQVFIAKDDGQVGTGLAVFTVAETGIAPDDFLVVFKNFSTYLSSGTFGPQGATPTFTQVKTDMGCMAPRSIQFISAEGTAGIMRLSHRGFALYDGLNDHLLSEAVRPYLFGKDEIIGLDWAHVPLSVASQSQNPPLYLCVCPILGQSGNTRAFVYDLVRRAWTICTFPIPFATLNFLVDPVALPRLVAGEQGGRRVFQLFSGAADDNGTPIPWRVRWAPITAPGSLTYVQRVLVNFFRIAARQIITGQMALGPVANRVYTSKVQRVSVGANAPVGSPLRNVVEDTASFEIGLTGDGAYFELSGAGSLGIRGIQYQVQPKPVGRPMRV